MTADEIIEMWEEDCEIDALNLSESSRRIPLLHAKYLKLLARDKDKLRRYRAAFKALRHEKYSFLINPTQEGLNKGWEIPEKGKLLKAEVDRYLEGDPELIKNELKIDLIEDRVDVLKEIIKKINAMQFIISNMIKDRAFMHGDN
jgi:hypothetical protein